MITPAERQLLEMSPFYRDQLAYLSYRALFADLKNSAQSLSDKLIGNGTITKSQLSAAQRIAG